jgi:hypothetical protein
LVEEHDWEEAKNCISLVVNSIVWDTSKHKVEIVEFYCADLGDSKAALHGRTAHSGFDVFAVSLLVFWRAKSKISS